MDTEPTRAQLAKSHAAVLHRVRAKHIRRVDRLLRDNRLDDWKVETRIVRAFDFAIAELELIKE